MSPDERSELERRIGRQLDADDARGAAETVLLGFGPEILGWLRATASDPDDADDAFSAFALEVLGAMSSFRRESSARTWAYVLARSARGRVARDPFRRRSVDASDASLEGIEQEIRTATEPYLRSVARSGFTRLRDELDPPDRDLLVLRVDRGMAWTDIALVLADPGPPDRDAVRRQAASLRKRFERVKERLRERAMAEGLLGDDA